MEKYFEVNRNILNYLFVSYPCFNSNCHGKIVVSLDSLHRNTRTQCPICKREDSFYLEKHGFELVERGFEHLYRQLRVLKLVPLAFSSALSPKTVFLDSMPTDDTLDTPP